jgi:membrane protein YqaA with SNARE-associated domain
MSEADASPAEAALAREPPAWTRGGWALPALFAGSVIESTILPWPIEFPLLAVMLRGRAHVFPAALAVTAGSVLGCVFAFLLGAFAYDAIAPQLAAHEGWAAAVAAAQDRAAARGAAAVFIGMMTPAPVQITSFAAGAAGVGLWAFVLASAAGRTIRYFAMAVLVFAFGPKIMDVWRARSRRTRRIALALIGVVFVIALVAAVMV